MPKPRWRSARPTPTQARPTRRAAAHELRTGKHVDDRPSLRQEANRGTVGSHRDYTANEGGEARARRRHTPLSIDTHDRLMKRVWIIGVFRTHTNQLALQPRV